MPMSYYNKLNVSLKILFEFFFLFLWFVLKVVHLLVVGALEGENKSCSHLSQGKAQGSANVVLDANSIIYILPHLKKNS